MRLHVCLLAATVYNRWKGPFEYGLVQLNMIDGKVSVIKYASVKEICIFVPVQACLH